MCLLVLLAGCQVGATSESAGTPSRCTPQVVRQVVERFIDAFNRGDIAQLDQLVSDQLFVWYSTDAPGQRVNADAMDRSTLMGYFADRHRQDEHLVLNSLDVTFVDARKGGFVFRLTRSADDGLPATDYGGKGEIQCVIVPLSVAVWSMGRTPWSPANLLPEAGAVLVIAAGITGIVVWRRRKARAALLGLRSRR